MQCHQFREIADSYLGNELSVETNHDINSHLEKCSFCRTELESRRALRATLKRAFVNAPENQLRPEFADRLGTQLRDEASVAGSYETFTKNSRFSFRAVSLVAAAACLLVAALIGFVMLKSWSNQDKAQSNPDHMLNLVKTELVKSAVGDHRDCAVHFRLAEKPIDLEQASQKFDHTYANLVPAVMAQGNLPRGLQFIEAHSCVFEGRRFAHIVFRYHDRLVSLLLTDNGGSETRPAPNSTTGGQQQMISCSQFDGYRVSCFQTARHAVFVVSDLTEGENLSLARALSPSIDAHITRAEQGT